MLHLPAHNSSIDTKIKLDYDSCVPGQYIDPDSYDYQHRYSSALKSLRTVCRLSWKCPHCSASNHSEFDGTRIRRSHGRHVEVKCGKCHGQIVTLLDEKSRTIPSAELLPHPR